LVVHLTNAQRQLIMSSWEKVNALTFTTPSGVIVKGPTRLYEEFYRRFFSAHPAGIRLFEEVGLEAQGRALVSMLALIIKSVEKPETVAPQIRIMGGRHEIYGVTASDYVAFSQAMCDTVEAVLSKDCNAETKDSWYKVMMELAAMMQDSARVIRSEGVSAILKRKMGGQTRKSMVQLDLDMLLIYRDENKTRLKSSVNFSDVGEIEKGEDDSSEFSINFVFKNPTAQPLVLIFPTTAEMKKWEEEITWRIAAVQRMWKDDESGSGSASAGKGGNLRGVLKMNKNVK